MLSAGLFPPLPNVYWDMRVGDGSSKSMPGASRSVRMGPKGEKRDAALGVMGEEVAVDVAESGLPARYASRSSCSSALAVGERINGRLILLYDQARLSEDASAVCGRSNESGGDSVSDGRLARSWGEGSGSVCGSVSACVTSVVTGALESGFGVGAGGCVADLGREKGSGADEMRLLLRRTSSASSLRTGDDARNLFGFGFAGSNNAMASETGTLLEVVWLKSSSRWAMSSSGRTASSSRTWSTEERDRWWDFVGILAVGAKRECDETNEMRPGSAEVFGKESSKAHKEHREVAG
jgi:hypothetical protein